MKQTHKVTMQMEFTECDTCSVKPGMPDLCLGCYKNRVVINTLLELYQDRQKDIRDFLKETTL